MMKVRKGQSLRPAGLIVAALLVTAVLSACAADPTPAPTEAPIPVEPDGGIGNGAVAELNGTSWTLTTINGEAVADGVSATMAFADGQVTGSGGCNGYGGKYVLAGNTVTFSEVMSTLMACEDPIMSVENAMMKILQGSATFSVGDQSLTLTLTGSDGTVLGFSAQ
jgi:putative lipoprotein